LYKPFYIFFCLFSLNLGAQTNLVVNPSFEDTASMTSDWPYLITSGWWNPNGFTADYFSPFCEELCCGSGVIHCVDEPDYLGFQIAQDGSSYLGLVIYETTGDTKEYAQGYLSELMLSGQSYCVGIWMALADSSSYISCDFQVAFTDELVQGKQLNNLFLQDYVSFEISEISDAEWTYYEGSYIASGGEQYIYLGSNTPNDQIDCIESLEPTWLNNACYILLDNLSVRKVDECAVTSSDMLVSQPPSVYPNPFDYNFAINNLSGEFTDFDLFDSSGRLLKKIDNYLGGAGFNTSQLESGVYYLVIGKDKIPYSVKIVKE
jgi:hypothetical protein